MWDMDGDGEFEVDNERTARRAIDTKGTYRIRLKVTDARWGTSSEAVRELTIP